MADYASFKVPELKKLLGDRGLPLTGNKADLIARLQENDSVKQAAKSNEDEIDWDDEQPAATAKHEVVEAPTEATMPAPAAAPANAAPAATAASEQSEAKVADAKATGEGAKDAAANQKEEGAPATKPTEGLSEDLAAIDLDEELKRREARAKRFGIASDGKSEESEEVRKLAARAARFGIDTKSALKDSILESFDTALSDRPLKRGRGDGGDRRGYKRATPDRRNGGGVGGGNNRSRNDRNDRRGHGPRGNNNNNNGGGGGGGQKRPSLLNDPVERKKAEERAKRFGL